MVLHFHTGTNKSWTLELFILLKLQKFLHVKKSKEHRVQLKSQCYTLSETQVHKKNRNTEFLSAFFSLFKSMPQIEASVNIVLEWKISCFLTFKYNFTERGNERQKELLNHCVRSLLAQSCSCSTFPLLCRFWNDSSKEVSITSLGDFSMA